VKYAASIALAAAVVVVIGRRKRNYSSEYYSISSFPVNELGGRMDNSRH
jgi:hypothetical protein